MVIQVKEAKLYVENGALKLKFDGEWVEPIAPDPDDEWVHVDVYAYNPGIVWYWYSGYTFYPDNPDFVRTLFSDITRAPDGRYEIGVSDRTGRKVVDIYYIEGGRLFHEPPPPPPTTVEVRFKEAVAYKVPEMTPITTITPDMQVSVSFKWIVTAPAGTKFTVEQYARAGSKEYVESFETGLQYHMYGEEWSTPTLVWEGGNLQAWLEIAQNTTVEIGQRIYYEGKLLAQGSVTLSFEVCPEIPPEVIVDNVEVIDRSTHIPVTQIEDDKEYYFRTAVRVKGSPGTKFHFTWYVPTPQGYFTLAEKEWTLTDCELEYDTYRIPSDYAVTGKWIIDMVMANIGYVSEIDVCCTVDWTWEGESKSVSGCSRYAIEIELPKPVLKKDQCSIDGKPPGTYTYRRGAALTGTSAIVNEGSKGRCMLLVYDELSEETVYSEEKELDTGQELSVTFSFTLDKDRNVVMYALYYDPATGEWVKSDEYG